MELTPSMQEPLLLELGMLGTKEAANQILAGTYVCLPGMGKHTRNFLNLLKALSLSGTLKINVLFSKEEFQSFWKKCNERSSSLISGLYYRHFKAAVDSNYFSKLHAIQLQAVTRVAHTLE